MERRVVITGLGLVTPLGIGVEETWSALLEGRSGIGEITRFDTTEFTTKIAGQVNGFKAEDFLPIKDAKRTERFIAFAVAAARMALESARLTIDEKKGPRVGVITGCGLGGLEMLETTAHTVREKGPKRCSPFFIPRLIGNMAPGMISIHLGAKGPNISVATACAAGAHAVGDACNTIKRGQADAMITGGVESVITPTCIAGFNAMKALSTRNDDPQKASRPFDRDRDGFVVGEGAGILVLEELQHALERGATILAEMAGYGQSGDGYHMTSPSPDGDGMIRCMQAAIDDAGIANDAIDYINAHGTSTPLNDLYETRAIKKVLGDSAGKVPVSSTKSMTGHLLGGAGGIETVFTVLALKNGIIPPTINLENPDAECDLDYVPNKARKANLTYAMSNSFGFGGTNASLIVKRYEP
ncbi:beta-ketoacyl-ACP synthase II [uncultured Desulfosarcina sp.]|uniref:beta-ketoacyl-ACP synthase II n=1 Tax=uncultured Desulfosarcina sp. TaxID=218289 RepID=UPI0029C7B2F4|nr:beta-ketoacyl-ACP synthase II [uncultured Desulfosarcina sp.]